MRRLDELNESSSNLSGSQRGVSPIIFNHASNQTPQKRISKTHACFSKQMIQKQIRREYVAGLEEELTQRPLALYPHYKDHMSPELFDKVASVLDPDMCVNSSSALPTPALGQVEEEKEENYTEPSKEEVDRAKQEKPASKMRPQFTSQSFDSSTDVQNPRSKNPYVLQMNANGTKKGRTVKVNQLSSHEDIKVAAKLFSNWFASKDEETNNSESTILRHFDSGLQDSSSPTFPIQEENTSEIPSQLQTGSILKAK